MKRYRKVLAALAISMCVMSTATMTSYAYTPEEIAAAKAWLSSNGYSPDMGGAQQAYQDYLDGKFGDQVPGDVNESIPIPEPDPALPGGSQVVEVGGETGEKGPDENSGETFVVDTDFGTGETFVVNNPQGTGTSNGEAASNGTGTSDKSENAVGAADADQGSGSFQGASGNKATANEGEEGAVATNFNKQFTDNILTVDKKQQMQKGTVIWNKMAQRSWRFVIQQNLWGMSARDFVEFMGVSAGLEKAAENDSTVLYESYDTARGVLYYFQFDKMKGLQAIQYTMFCKDAEELKAVKEASRQECIAALEGKSRDAINNGLLVTISDSPILRRFPSLFEGRYQSEHVFHCYIKR